MSTLKTTIKSEVPEKTFESPEPPESTSGERALSSLSGVIEDKEQVSDLALTNEEKDRRIDEMALEMGINHRRFMWKLDFFVVPPFILLYFLAFLDRVNISNAKVYGMEDDLGLHGNQFNTALTIFFVPYVFFEVLSNYLMKIIKPHIWLSAMIFLFGIAGMCQAFVKGFGGLLACRFFLGVFESGSFPALFYLLSAYYCKRESQRRFSFFFSCTCLAGGCAGAIAYRIHSLDGVRGFASWQWIFLIEGAITSFLAIVLFFTIADFPEEARFLSNNERKFLKRKLEYDAGKSAYEVKLLLKDVGGFYKLPAAYLSALCYFALVIPSYGYAYFAPTIIKFLGYTAWEANKHSIYPWICAWGVTCVLAFISDKIGRRWPFAFFSCCLAIAGFVMVMVSSNYSVQYAGCFLAVTGLYSAMPAVVCLFSLNFAGHRNKSVGTSTIVGFGNIGGIISPWLFPNSDAPGYHMGMAVSVFFVVFAVAMTFSYTAYTVYLNRIKNTEAYREKWALKDKRAQLIAGDLHPDFKYMY
ncbi:hypothetical protein FOA43_002939 [Brettanomyces nanus]|uniref:Major facilitator superfamily (MFS) profile domain-containing protein n=1 Tax=Eeniella nana TaxID=13502 RepID=A0A875S6F9_EENNA|nr:uncharacterized protein FOA43_002939 [Brettanomyces nanus]QPG75582.1 hypothetical protein FOA43_002939 [Brettanomyces nanus]